MPAPEPRGRLGRVVSVPSPRDPEALRARYDEILVDATPPFAFVDLDALRANADQMLGQAAGLPIRVASKSVRSLPVLRRIFELDERFQGILSFTLPEALFLADEGFHQIFVGYPTTDPAALDELAAHAAKRPDAHPALMVDDAAQLDLIDAAARLLGATIRVAVDIDPSWWVAGGRLARIGPKRSPIRTADQARRLAAEIERRDGTRLVGAMAYEGHIAGVGDDVPGRPLRSAAIRFMQGRSEAELADRLPGVIAALREVADLEFVNCGGHGQPGAERETRGRHRADRRVRVLCPRAVRHLPLAGAQPRGHVLPARDPPATGRGSRPRSAGATSRRAHPGATACPVPYLPAGLRLDRDEGAGEVQTPLGGPGAERLRVGDRVYLRHAKAGELCERFDSLYLVEGGAIVDQVPTYRGAGHTFL